MQLRNEVKEEEKWDLSDLFENDENWESFYDQLFSEISELTKYRDTFLNSKEDFLSCMKLREKIGIKVNKVHIYAHLKNDEDTTNSKYQEYMSKVSNLLSEFSNKTTFIDSKILDMDKDKLDSLLSEKELEKYRFYIEKLIKTKKHKLSEKEEELIATLSPNFEGGSKSFFMINNADIKFENVVDKEGKTHKFGAFEYSKFIESKDRVLRKSSYDSLYKSYINFSNTFATTLDSNTRVQTTFAKVRQYSSSRNMSLSRNFIDESVYDSLVNTVNSRLDLLHRFVKLRKEVLNLDTLYPYDMYVPLLEELDLSFTFEEAKEIILEAVKVLGDEYRSLIKKAFDERWIDYAVNKGKRGGAYSSGAYGTKPYILISWNGTISSLYTLIHELGHSLHSYYTRNTQPYIYGYYSIFLAEVASTTNELLLSDYLLKKYDDNEKVKTYILNNYCDRIKATLYRQTQFAEFEQNIHKIIEQGSSLTAPALTKLYGSINEKYYGKDLISDENIRYEWARIPHFYYTFYVYQYATGISAAFSFAKKILNEGEEAVKKYIDFLKAGCSDYPLDILEKAGVNMRESKPVNDCLDGFEEKLSELESLLKK